jgi:hypothetical protein
MSDNLFLDGLRGAYDCRLILESKITRDAVSISNWSKQLIGNRAGSQLVEVDLVMPDKTYQVKLANWQPVRDVEGYNGESVATPASGSSDIWSQYRDRLAGNPAMEAAALIGYLFDQLLTGKILSSESAGKAFLLDKLIATIKPKDVVIRIKPVATFTETMEWHKSDVISLIKLARPRFQAILNLESRQSSRKARTKRKVVKL